MDKWLANEDTTEQLDFCRPTVVLTDFETNSNAQIDFLHSRYQMEGSCAYLCGSDSKRIWVVFWSRTLTGAVLYGGCPCDGGGSIEGTGEAVGAAMFRLVVISRTRVTGNQTGTGEMACRTGDCGRGDERGWEEKNEAMEIKWSRWKARISQRCVLKKVSFAGWKVQQLGAPHL